MEKIVNPFVYHEVELHKQVAPTITTWLHPTYAQRYEDVIVMSLLDAMSLKTKTPLRFGYVEIGANHPVATSSTFLMRQKYGARGMLVEPNPELAKNLRKFRPEDEIIQAACVADNSKEIEIIICNDANELTSSDPVFTKRFIDRGMSYSLKTVRAINVNELMDMASQNYDIYYLSIDVEGPDVDILAAINYDEYRPCIIQIEASESIKPGNTQRIRDIMTKNGYVFIAHTFINLIFIDAERL